MHLWFLELLGVKVFNIELIFYTQWFFYMYKFDIISEVETISMRLFLTIANHRLSVVNLQCSVWLIDIITGISGDVKAFHIKQFSIFCIQ